MKHLAAGLIFVACIGWIGAGFALFSAIDD